MNKIVAIGIGIAIAIVVTAYVTISDFSFEKTKEIGEKNNVNPIIGKNKTYEISVSETVGVKSPP